MKSAITPANILPHHKRKKGRPALRIMVRADSGRPSWSLPLHCESCIGGSITVNSFCLFYFELPDTSVVCVQLTRWKSVSEFSAYIYCLHL